jgi:hypothetical protein
MGPPLPARRARQRLAGTILSALHEPAARRLLASLARDAGAASGWLATDEADQRGAVMARARRANLAVGRSPLHAPPDDLADALESAAILFDAGLFFETHEVLEPHWRQASGDAREVLQALIQIAVGYQHEVNGNSRGARSLLGAGARRLQGRRLRGVGMDRFARAVARTAEPARARRPGQDLAVPPFPRGWRGTATARPAARR